MFYIWTTNKAKNPGACQYYRIKVPMEQLEILKYAHVFEDVGNTPRDTVKAMLSSDICHFYAVGGEEYLYQMQVINSMKPARLGDKIQYPPICVYDTDDNADFVHPMNPTFIQLGVRGYPDLKLLEPGDCIEIEWPDGRREVTLEDKVSHNREVVFDIERNLKEMKLRHEMIRLCAGATTTTAELASYFKDVIGQPNVHVFPNTIVPEHYKQFKVIRPNTEEIRIFWQGGISHYIDWYGLKDALKEISQKYSNIKWVIFGTKYDWVHNIIPESMIEYHDWVSHDAYKLHRCLLNIDINLCPLAKDVFNRCKSAIKWYEASILNEPEATLASNVGPYHEIENGITGLVYDTPREFVEKLSILIENAELRKTLGANAKKWVLDNRTPEKTIPALAEFYLDLKERQKQKYIRS